MNFSNSRVFCTWKRTAESKYILEYYIFGIHTLTPWIIWVYSMCHTPVTLFPEIFNLLQWLFSIYLYVIDISSFIETQSELLFKRWQCTDRGFRWVVLLDKTNICIFGLIRIKRLAGVETALSSQPANTKWNRLRILVMAISRQTIDYFAFKASRCVSITPARCSCHGILLDLIMYL